MDENVNIYQVKEEALTIEPMEHTVEIQQHTKSVVEVTPTFLRIPFDLTIDDILNGASANPVENQVIYTKFIEIEGILDGKLETVAVDGDTIKGDGTNANPLYADVDVSIWEIYNDKYRLKDSKEIDICNDINLLETDVVDEGFTRTYDVVNVYTNDYEFYYDTTASSSTSYAAITPPEPEIRDSILEWALDNDVAGATVINDDGNEIWAWYSDSNDIIESVYFDVTVDNIKYDFFPVYLYYYKEDQWDTGGKNPIYYKNYRVYVYGVFKDEDGVIQYPNFNSMEVDVVFSYGKATINNFGLGELSNVNIALASNNEALILDDGVWKNSAVSIEGFESEYYDLSGYGSWSSKLTAVGEADDIDIRLFPKGNGTFYFQSTLNLQNNRIGGLSAPTTSNDATRKSYVDGLINGIDQSKWTLTGSDIYRNSKVGIGKTPTEKLDIDGNVKAAGYKTGTETGITSTQNVVSDIRDNGGQLQKKTQLLTFTNGLLTSQGAESDWTNTADI